MNPEIFSQEEQKQLLECVAAIQKHPIYESTEFEAVFGLSRDEVRAVFEAFPEWDLYDEGAEGTDHSWIVLNNAFAWLMGGTAEERSMIHSGIPFNKKAMTVLFQKFKAV